MKNRLGIGQKENLSQFFEHLKAGSERFQCIASAYYRGANTVVICFDFSRIETLNTTRKWLDQAIAENPKQEVSVIYSQGLDRTFSSEFLFKFLLFLVGLKRDLVNDETAKSIEKEAIAVAKSLNAEYWSVSGTQAITWRSHGPPEPQCH